jgi:hypothetical protein
MRDIIEIKLENLGIAPREFKRLEDDDLLEFFINSFNLTEPMIVTKTDTELVKENERMREELRKLFGVERPFICGVAGGVGADNMADYVLVCPSYGADGAAMYKKYKDYSAPEY